MTEPSSWALARPFFRVLPEKGGYTAFEKAAAARGVQLLRAIERRLGAKSVFALGIPGQVGPAAQALWRELIEVRSSIRIWPFDGSLDDLLSQCEFTVAEIYPKAAYGTALAPSLSAEPLRLAKGSLSVRQSNVKQLQSADWVHGHRIRLDDLDYAVGNEDDFDACLTAAALLRLVLEHRGLANPSFVDIVSEGGILCT